MLTRLRIWHIKRFISLTTTTTKSQPRRQQKHGSRQRPARKTWLTSHPEGLVTPLGNELKRRNISSTRKNGHRKNAERQRNVSDAEEESDSVASHQQQRQAGKRATASPQRRAKQKKRTDLAGLSGIWTDGLGEYYDKACIYRTHQNIAIKRY